MRQLQQNMGQAGFGINNELHALTAFYAKYQAEFKFQTYSLATLGQEVKQVLFVTVAADVTGVEQLLQLQMGNTTSLRSRAHYQVTHSKLSENLL